MLDDCLVAAEESVDGAGYSEDDLAFLRALEELACEDEELKKITGEQRKRLKSLWEKAN